MNKSLKLLESINEISSVKKSYNTKFSWKKYRSRYLRGMRRVSRIRSLLNSYPNLLRLSRHKSKKASSKKTTLKKINESFLKFF